MRPRSSAGRAAIVAVAGFGVLAWMARDHVLPETSPMQRGAALAEELDCWSCHAAALRDPDHAAAPSLFGGSRRPQEIAQRIREAEGHIRAISDAELASLVAWIAVVQYEADRAAEKAPIRGGLPEVERLARRQCFSCHGDLGQGGVSNPGSLKGYVPGFFGRDYDALTWGDDPDVVREWIRDGLPGFFHWGVGRLRPGLWYSERQQVRMPAFGRTLSPRQWEELASYMSLLRELGPLDASGVVEYRRRLGLPLAEDGSRGASRAPASRRRPGRARPTGRRAREGP